MMIFQNKIKQSLAQISVSPWVLVWCHTVIITVMPYILSFSTKHSWNANRLYYGMMNRKNDKKGAVKITSLKNTEIIITKNDR